MDGIHFIGPNLTPVPNEEAIEILRVAGLPEPYRKDNQISEHLIRACIFDAVGLSVEDHVNMATGRRFECVSYYSEDQECPALCTKEELGYVATMSAAFVRRLVRISSRIGVALNLRPRTPSDASQSEPQTSLQRDPQLHALLEGNAEVCEAEALEIVSSWPSPWEESQQIDLGSYTLFYDLIRLVWMHEWAHALCGHVTTAQEDLGLSRLYEFSTERAGVSSEEELPFPRNEVLQAIEMHADEFAVRYCVNEILTGYDPMGDIAGPRIDLVDRLLLFNVACCVFAVVWTLAENRYAPEDTFYPPLPPVTSDEPYPLFVTTESTHPPAVLRYERFRNFQRELTMQYGLKKGSTKLSAFVDASSFGFLRTLGEISPYFFSLMKVTPMVGISPARKRLEAYEKHLLSVGAYLNPKLEESCYLPTARDYWDNH